MSKSSSILEKTRLSNKTLKIIGGVLIVLGIFLSDPPTGLFPPDDFLNPMLAGVIVFLTGMSFAFALLLTYTLIGWGILVAGILIYPKKNETLINEIIMKAKGFIHSIIKSPVKIAIVAFSLYIIYHLYAGIL